MQTAISIGSAYATGEDWDGLVEYARAADRLGVDFAWSAEAWGMDAVVPLAYLAAVTERIRLGSGILQISARTPSMTAMTSQSLHRVSGGRFVLGLGVSGPQVVEGLHGAAFAKPLTRLRESVEVIRMGLRGEKLRYEGEHLVLPRPGGEGKPIRLAQPPVPDLPIYLATLGPKSLEYTGEVAQGWLGTSFVPEHADVFWEPMRRGAERAGRSLCDIDLQIGVHLEISDDVERLIDQRRPAMAFTLGAMGSPKTNFYNAAYRRGGWADAAIEVQSLWVEGKREEAVARVPDEMVLQTSLIGTEQMVRERLEAYRSAGVTTLRLQTAGTSYRDQIATLEHAVDLVHGSTG